MPASLLSERARPRGWLTQREGDALADDLEGKVHASAGHRGVPMANRDDLAATWNTRVDGLARGTVCELDPHGGFGAEVVPVDDRAVDRRLARDTDLLRPQHDLHVALRRGVPHGNRTQ